MSEDPTFPLKVELGWEREGGGRGLTVSSFPVLTACSPGAQGSFLLHPVTLGINTFSVGLKLPLQPGKRR